ncbi:MAG: hypothetical protein CMM02_18345 [Rhodopirellula sp.]|nr:hypothetical protein [Rhodopirellula sp.]|tara:strand:+ start:9146 stop:11128 length:1983 start_codon:yes stop_codon:yes gene_type:complete
MANSTLASAVGNCTPRHIHVDDSKGCSLTRANITAFKRSDFEAQAAKEVGMDRIIAQTAEARLAGMHEKSLYDLLLSRHVSLGEKSGGGSQSVIAPFTLVPRRNTLNFNYFQVESSSYAGITDNNSAVPTGNFTALTKTFGPGRTVTGYGWIPSSAFVITVNAGTDSAPGGGSNNLEKTNFNKSQVQNLETYFHPGSFINVLTNGKNLDGAATGANAHVAANASSLGVADAVYLQYKVYYAEAVASGAGDYDANQPKARLVVAPSSYASTSATDGLDKKWIGSGVTEATAAEKANAGYTMSKGTGMIMGNSVSDYEKWCEQGPAVNDLTLIEYWQQTQRWTHQYNDEYLKALQAPLTSEYFKKFRQLPLAQQRKQQEQYHQNAFMNSVFYGQKINDNQTVETYTSLPTVVDPNTGQGQNPAGGHPWDGCSSAPTIEYKSNTLGIRTQLNDCSRTWDNQGAALNLDVLFETVYMLKRERENSGGTVDTIDAMTDRFTAAKIRDLMTKYYKAKYSSDLTLFMQPKQQITFNDQVVFEYNVYDLPDQGVSLAVFTDTFFDDKLGAHLSITDGTNTTKNLGRQLWLIDWSDIQINVIKTASVKRQTNTADDLYNCVIQPNVSHYQLNSKTFEVRVGNTNRHALVENFSDASPSVTVSGADVTVS